MRADASRQPTLLKPYGTGVAIPNEREEKAMKTHSEIVVTLSDDLLEGLRTQARELKVPLKWLVAGLVCDTIDPVEQPIDQGSPHPTRQVA
jgi:hypothetical protein